MKSSEITGAVQKGSRRNAELRLCASLWISWTLKRPDHNLITWNSKRHLHLRIHHPARTGRRGSKMSQPGAGPPAAAATAAADVKSQKAQGQQPNKAQQQNKAADNRSKVQQNKERAAQGRARKANNVTFTEEGSAINDGSAPASISEASAKQPKKQPKKETPKPRPARQAKAATQFKSKVVIRRLPPNLPEEVFWKAVFPWIRDKADCQALAAATTAAAPTQTSSESTSGDASSSNSASSAFSANAATATVDYRKFVTGKLKTDTNKQNKHARAYVRFLDPQSLVQFHKAFDGHIFRDSKGKESVAIVEFAPYQKVVLPPAASGQRGRRSKPDPKQGTIEKDADYLSFVDRLNKVGDDVKRSEGELLASLHDPKGREKEKEAKEAAGKATPLLQHLRAVKMAKLESAAAIKKAKKMEKAAAKAAAANSAGPASKGGAAAAAASAEEKAKAKKCKKKEKAKEEPKLVAAAGEGVKPEEGVEDASIKKKEKSKKRKGKANGDNNAVDGNARGSAQKDAKGASSRKPDAKTPSSGTDAAQGEGTSKAGKLKSKPPRRKGGPKDKAKSSTADTNPAATQPAKIQILKRES